MGYSGIGYPNGVWQYYYRNFSYYPNSGCPYAFMTLWVDCYNCGGDPPGYKSKGWQVEAPLIVDHTNPVFDGIEVIYGAEIDDYVSNVLIPDLQSRGIVYTADNQTGDAAYLYTRYMQLVGYAIDEDDVVLVVKGDDPPDAGSDQGSWLHDFIGIDFVNGNGQFGYIDDAWEDLFHVDEPPCASQERSSEYWPKVTAGNLWWDEGPPPDLHLHTDGYGHGEYSCWVAPIPCEWFDYQGAKLRIRDDVNNWTHSENLVSGEELGIDIVQPSGCGDTPADRCEFLKGERVEFNAEVTGAEYTEDLEGLIDWYVLKDDGQGGWTEIDYDDYPTSGFESVMQGPPWRGPTFVVNELLDLDFQVRAKIVACGMTFFDDCFVKDNPDYDIVDIKFIVSDTYEGGAQPCAAGFCDAPAIARPDGWCSVEYAVQVFSDIDYHENPSMLTEPIETTVSCPSDPTTLIIDSTQYLVNPDSARHAELAAMFPSDPPQGKHEYFYSRGTSLVIPDYEDDEAMVLVVQDWDTVNTSAHEPWQTPTLFISDDDSALGSETDHPAYWADAVRDYSCALGWEQGLLDSYKFVLDSAYFGDNKRGYFWPQDCDSDKERHRNAASNVLRCGAEVLMVSADDLHAEIGVQSRGDILFLFTHGKPAPPSGWTNAQYQQHKITAIGPFEDPGGPTGLKNICLSEWQNSGALDTEVDWIVTTSCLLLNDASWEDWKKALVDTGLVDSICGFRFMNFRNELPGVCRGQPPGVAFFEDFSERISSEDMRVHGSWSEYAENTCTDFIACMWLDNASVWANNIVQNPDHRYDGELADPLEGVTAITEDDERFGLRRGPSIWGDPAYTVIIIN